MRKILCAFLIALVASTLIKPEVARAEMPAKARAFVTIIGYGTAGGALLGAASMAFGTSSRAIAQGASLGLYAGILFGSYVLVSHHNKRYGSYDDNGSPYQESNDIYGDEYKDGDEGGSGDSKSSGGGFFDRFDVIQDKLQTNSFTLGGKKVRNPVPPIQVNLLSLEF